MYLPQTLSWKCWLIVKCGFGLKHLMVCVCMSFLFGFQTMIFFFRIPLVNGECLSHGPLIQLQM